MADPPLFGPPLSGLSLPDPFLVEPLTSPPDATATVPGSKSLTNRALVAAALADGTSRLEGALFADDAAAMLECLAGLRVQVAADPARATIELTGLAGRLPEGSFELDARLSGTTSRFLLPVLALGAGLDHLDGAEPLRARPMATSLDALAALGATIEAHGRPGHLPVTVSGGPVRGGTVAVAGDGSSQFTSGLLLAAPAMAEGMHLRLTSTLVSRPFVDMTVAVMGAFGATADEAHDGAFVVPPGRYRATRYLVEPDASAASYLLAAAAITGGRVTVAGLGRHSLQGDLAFLTVLEQMGATVERGTHAITVVGPGSDGLEGGEFDLSALPDMAQTLAVVAPFARSPTRVTGVGFIRGHETDRIRAVVTELGRCGIHAVEEADGFVVHPGRPRPAVVQTYHDHRMAMSFALLGLAVPGIAIADPACVAKTFPGYFAALDGLRAGPAGGAG